VSGVLRPGRRYVQFTYSARAWQRFAVPGFRPLPARRVWRNLPPAVVLPFERDHHFSESVCPPASH
jgi:phospholipid N-methyltransferase